MLSTSNKKVNKSASLTTYFCVLSRLLLLIFVGNYTCTMTVVMLCPWPVFFPFLCLVPLIRRRLVGQIKKAKCRSQIMKFSASASAPQSKWGIKVHIS